MDKAIYIELAVLALFALFYSLVAGRLERSPITGPIAFLGFGLLAGPLGAGWLELQIGRDWLRILADLTLALVLFIDASNANLKVLRGNIGIPLRLLGLGLPMTIALGVVVGTLLFDQLSIWELVILAVMLTATDAALGKPVVTNKAVPARIREGLNVESGLNDGICVPLLFAFIVFAEAGNSGQEGFALVLTYMVEEIGVGVGVGLGLTAMAAWLMKHCLRRGWVTEVWGQLPVIMLAFLCFTVAQSLHGSGYIAAFVGGILFGLLAKESTHKLVLNAEGLAETLAMFTWIVCGAAVINLAYPLISWQVVVYALASLTMVRMLPVLLCLSGSGERIESKLFLAWFGPRGLASIVFAVIVLNTDLPGAGLMAPIVVCTVIFSIVLHGLTANPLASALAARLRRV